MNDETVIESVIDHFEPPFITFASPDGKRGYLELVEGKIVYSGDLDVDESAQLLFDAFETIIRMHIDK